MKVHPAAEAFPLLGEVELAELADDIRENGLRFPIIVDADGQLLDGRNRMRACEIAGVEPTFETYVGDPLAYIVSANVARRHLTAGQRAIGVAMIYPEPFQRGGRKDRGAMSRDVTLSDVTRQRLHVARAVLRFSPVLAEAVKSGAMTLDEAHAQVTAHDRQLRNAESDRRTLDEVPRSRSPCRPGGSDRRRSARDLSGARYRGTGRPPGAIRDFARFLPRGSGVHQDTRDR